MVNGKDKIVSWAEARNENLTLHALQTKIVFLVFQLIAL